MTAAGQRVLFQALPQSTQRQSGEKHICSGRLGSADLGVSRPVAHAAVSALIGLCS